MDSGNQTNQSKKPFSYVEIYNSQVEHYAKLAMNPATYAHAKFMVRQLIQEPSGLFKNLGRDVAARIKELKDVK